MRWRPTFVLITSLGLVLMSCDGPTRRIPLRPDVDAAEDEGDDDDDDDDDGDAPVMCGEEQCTPNQPMCSQGAEPRCVECLSDADCKAGERCERDGECD